MCEGVQPGERGSCLKIESPGVFVSARSRFCKTELRTDAGQGGDTTILTVRTFRTRCRDKHFQTHRRQMIVPTMDIPLRL